MSAPTPQAAQKQTFRHFAFGPEADPVDFEGACRLVTTYNLRLVVREISAAVIQRLGAAGERTNGAALAFTRRVHQYRRPGEETCKVSGIYHLLSRILLSKALPRGC